MEAVFLELELPQGLLLFVGHVGQGFAGRRYFLYNISSMASPISLVLAVPPRSGVIHLVPSSLVISSPVNKMKYIRCKWKYDG